MSEILREEFDPVKDLSLALEGTNHIMSLANPFHTEEEIWANYLLQNIPNPQSSLLTDIELLILKFNHLLRWDTQKSGDKRTMLESLQNAAKAKRSSSFVMDQLLLIADEWFTNAERCLRELGRGTIQVDLYHSDRSLWLFVKDDYGKLNLHQLITRILLAYKNGVLEVMERKRDGAGIGSYLAFRNSVTWLAAVRPEQETLLGARLLLDRNHDHMAQVAKSVHFPRGI